MKQFLNHIFNNLLKSNAYNACVENHELMFMFCETRRERENKNKAKNRENVTLILLLKESDRRITFLHKLMLFIYY